MRKILYIFAALVFLASCSSDDSSTNTNNGNGLSINVSATKMQINEQRQFVATVVDSTLKQNIRWSVEPSSVSIVSDETNPQYVIITAPATAQTVTLTAYLSNATSTKASATITVEETVNLGSVIYDNGNKGGVDYDPVSVPTTATQFTLEGSALITYFSTYHYFNNGLLPGTVAFKHSDGTIYGPYQTSGTVGQGGVSNAYWVAYPFVIFKAGTYTVVDSDPATWSFNSESNDAGFTCVKGITQ